MEDTDLQQAFQGYISKTTADAIARDPEAAGVNGDRRTISLLIADLEGTTSLINELPPQELITLLRTYLKEMTDVILDRFGTIDKYEGDRIIAYWGAPLQSENHAEQACHTALEMERVLQTLRSDNAIIEKHNLSVRYGIHTGPVVVGNLGSGQRFSYGVLGEAFGTAYALEQANKTHGTKTLISDSTYRQIKDRAKVNRVGPIEVGAGPGSVEAYELMKMT